jgi:radical SAM superfamily enzyme YgiQ (UPF0313 family)
MDELHIPDTPPYRPPSEAETVLVRVTRGCAWNRCAFCGMYKTLRFEARPLEEIEADLAALREQWPRAESIFLADSDALVHPKIVPVIEAVRRTFPEAERVTTYTRMHTLRQKPLATLQAMRRAGLTRVHTGLESGAREILERVHKGATPETAIEAGQRAIAAGFNLCCYVLSGLGGERDWESHAAGTADVLAAIAPHFVRLRALVLLPGSPLRETWRAGEFTSIAPRTRLRETERLLTGLLAHAPAREIEIASDHVSNYIWADGELIYGGVSGFIPQDGALMLAALRAAAEAADAARRVYDPATLALDGRADVYSVL